jgi:hypothetical protein
MKARLPMRQLLHFSIYLMAFTSCAQEDSTATPPQVQYFIHTLGTTQISLRVTTFDTTDAWFFIQLHDDENTAETAARCFLQQHGGTLLSIENKNERYIRFLLNGRKHLFDPNRMFTTHGIRQNLQFFGSYSLAAAKAVKNFRDFLLDFMPNTALMVAVHNNTEERYTIHSYKTDKTLKRDANSVHINPEQDSDDFFITTDDGLFKKLADAGYNCVLQHKEAVTDDGSLSVYYGKRGGRYVNVEAQAGHLVQQQDMLHALREALRE